MEWRLHDPCAWKDGEWFYMASGSQIGKPRAIGTSRDAGFLFRSRDAVDWEYAGLLYEPGGESDLAVPSFFPFGDGHMLLFASHSRGAQYYLGPYAERPLRAPRARPLQLHQLGPRAGHARLRRLDRPQLLAGPGRKRRIVITWIAEGRTPGGDGEGRLGRRHVAAVGDAAGARTAACACRRCGSWKGCAGCTAAWKGAFADDGEQILPGIAGDTIELRAEIDPGSADEAGLKLRCDLDGEEETVLTWERGSSRIRLDVSRSSADPEFVGRDPQVADLDHDPDRPLLLRIFLDRSVVEVFAGDRVLLTKRIYPQRDRQHRYPHLRPGRAREPAFARVMAAPALPLLQSRSLGGQAQTLPVGGWEFAARIYCRDALMRAQETDCTAESLDLSSRPSSSPSTKLLASFASPRSEPSGLCK